MISESPGNKQTNPNAKSARAKDNKNTRANRQATLHERTAEKTRNACAHTGVGDAEAADAEVFTARSTKVDVVCVVKEANEKCNKGIMRTTKHSLPV